MIYPQSNIKSLNYTKFRQYIGILLFCIVLPSYSIAQIQNCKWIKVGKQSFQLDSLTILPESIQIQGNHTDSLKIIYDLNSNLARFSGNTQADSVLICYQSLPFNLSKKDYKRNPALYDSTDTYTDAFLDKIKPFEERREELFEMKGINSTGNITRGISFGNTQNVFVNSSLNLQLDGKLSEDISIVAAISDQNVPFQPEGNTQQIQDFDRVFVRLSHKFGSLTAGDVVFQQKENYFLKFYKNVQGAYLQTDYTNFGKSKASTTLGTAVSKGKFASITIKSLEGIQGPYRLTGPNNERFIIVLANSEKVFIDGKQLQRGFNLDYVVDYNLAEITFNNNILITQFTRIRVDFEYSERNYGRTTLTASHYQQFDKFNFYFNFYQEADNPRNPTGIDLTNEDKLSLSQAGDGLAFISGIDSTGFVLANVLYKRTDTTTINDFYRDILVYSTDENLAVYRATFSDVGQGNGDYREINTTVNGKIYAWVEPLNGISQGNFAPVRVVPTPIKKQLITLGTNYRFSESEKIYGEIAFSNQDLNRYSSLGSEDDQGTAFKIGFQNTGKNLSFLKDYQWLGSIDYEFDSEFFRPIDRFRPIEFDRDWSTQIDTSQIADHILNTSLGIKKDLNNNLIYTFSHRQRGGQVKGWQQRIDFDKELGKFLLKTDVFLLKNQQNFNLSEWQRISTDIAYRSKIATLGYRYNLDKNKITVNNTDSIISTAMNFDEHVFYLKSPDTAKVRLFSDFSLRFDNLPVSGQLQRSLEAKTANFGLNTILQKTQQIALIATYRTIRNLLDSTQNAANQDNIMGRLDWNGTFFEKHIRSELSFASATGRELRKEFIFLQVQTGQGTHTWRDENEDAIQDLNEFYLAINPDERNYIKVFLPTSDYIKAFTNNFSYRLNWEAPRNWRNLGGVKAFISKFSNTSSWTINRRFTDESLAARLLPFNPVVESNLLSTQEILRTTLFFNRTNPQYGLDVIYLDGKQKQLLTNGFDARNNQEVRINSRVNLGKFFNFRLNAARQFQENRSDFLLTRNYNISTCMISPELAYQPQNDLRITSTYTFSKKINNFISENAENAQIHQLAIEARWNKLSKRNLLVNIRYVNIAFGGEINTPVAYDMLEALQPGTNWTWSLNWQQRLSNGLQLSINYDGRKSPQKDVVHIGRMQLTALF